MKGQFNIGLTNRNFTKDPDQKLFWTMINWSNPGVLGKVADFYDVDNEHLCNLRQPYDKWWQRLTWKYCNSFTPPTDNEIKEYRTVIKEWSKTHSLHGAGSLKSEVSCETKKRKRPSPVSESPKTKISRRSHVPKKASLSVKEESEANIKEEVPDITNAANPFETTAHDETNDSISSNDTVIYDFKDSPMSDADENPILSSIISGKSFRTQECPDIKSTTTDTFSVSNTEVTNDSDDDIVTSIMRKKSSRLAGVSRKNEILSVLYGDDE